MLNQGLYVKHNQNERKRVGPNTLDQINKVKFRGRVQKLDKKSICELKDGGKRDDTETSTQNNK